jgi:hypothetical protein
MPLLPVNPFLGGQSYSEVSTTPLHPPGFRHRAQDSDLGNITCELMYVQGVTGSAVGSAVTINTFTGATALATTRSRGLIGFTTTAIPAGSWGWAVVGGVFRVLISGTITAGQSAYLTATPGTLSSTVVAGDEVFNGTFLTANGVPVAGMARMSLANPFVGDTDNA